MRRLREWFDDYAGEVSLGLMAVALALLALYTMTR